MIRHPERVWALQGASNFRDLGGYVGRDGRHVRWRRIFRSDHLGALTEDDRAQLRAIGVRRAVDFRGVDERAARPYEHSGLTSHALTIEPTVVQSIDGILEAGQDLTPAIVGEFMRELYRRLVNEQAHRFAALFGLLLQSDAPLVFHCTAGKDRTGVAAALILLALGVPLSVVKDDYLLTNALYRHPEIPPGRIAPEALAVLWSVREDFLDAALRAIESEHGGIERYLRDRLGLDRDAREALESRYLEEG